MSSDRQGSRATPQQDLEGFALLPWEDGAQSGCHLPQELHSPVYSKSPEVSGANSGQTNPMEGEQMGTLPRPGPW